MTTIGTDILHNCGVFAWPQIALSVLTVGLLGGYLLALRRGEIPRGCQPWNRTLEPLAGIATTVGLLGSVAGFIVAFRGFTDGLDVDSLTRGLAGAYWTTGVGIVTALVASGGAYALTVLHRTEA
ncbi:MAG: MotA/TolQ/ExbB proton channel family protein [Phycisphaerae bacterium]